MTHQPTSNPADKENTVSEGLAIHLDRMIEDATRKYPGGTAKANLAKGHPGFVKRLWEIFDELADEQALHLPIIERPAWKVLQRTCNDAKSYISALESGGYKIGNWARDIMNKLAFMAGFDVNSVELMLATTKELTGKDTATTTEIFDAIRKVGSLCPAWAGPELRKQYSDQPNGEWLRIAMEPIVDSNGGPGLFSVERDGSGLWLDYYFDVPDHFWHADDRWVFCRRK
ncbi:MAG: hypothetical protein WC805_03500 [Patescibacteria group bacterium]|jgi:hypothetical protein